MLALFGGVVVNMVVLTVASVVLDDNLAAVVIKLLLR